MEGTSSKVIISEFEQELLEESFFVISYNDLRDQLSDPEEAACVSGIKHLLELEYLDQMTFNDKASEFGPMKAFDIVHLEQYHYLASKKGMLALTGLS